MEILSVNVGMPQTLIIEGKELVTGIYKSPVPSAHALHLTKTQLAGDGQADLEVHGGPDKALCVYCIEHYPYWEERLGMKMEYGAFGENLTVRGLLEENVCIGDTFELGEAIVQVSQPRQPCHKLAKRYHAADLPVQVQQTGFTGYYFRVLKEGIVPANPLMKRIATNPEGVTVAAANKLKYQDKHDMEGIKRILSVDALSQSWRNSFEKRLASLQS